jgi:hypothetical protein
MKTKPILLLEAKGAKLSSMELERINESLRSASISDEYHVILIDGMELYGNIISDPILHGDETT